MTREASDIQRRAAHLIGLRLEMRPAPEARLASFRGAVVAEMLLDLERAFGIGLDVDEVLPHGAVGDLIDLVLIRAQAAGQDGAPRPAPQEACRLYDLAAERARRAHRPRRVEVA